MFKEMWKGVIDNLLAVIGDSNMDVEGEFYEMYSEEVNAISEEIVDIHPDDEIAQNAAYIYWLYFHPQFLNTLTSIVKDEKKRKRIEEKMKSVSDYYYRTYVKKGKGISIKNETDPDPTKPGGIDLRAVVLTPVNYSPTGVGI